MTTMELVAANPRTIRELVARNGPGAIADSPGITAHVSLGGGLDPTWLDLFSEACRAVTGSDEPRNFLDARSDIDIVDGGDEMTVERVDPAWIDAVAALDDRQLDSLAGHWIDLLEQELGAVSREDKPSIRNLTSELILFARAARGAPDVLFTWAL
jgi:hypothetical protein